MKGDPGITSVAVKMMGKDTLEKTDMRDGKVISVFKLTVAADGKTAKLLLTTSCRRDLPTST